jgi:two-component system, NarL family, response regulator NreC
MDRIKVLVADDHTVLREGLRLLLEAQPDIEVVGEASDGREAVEAAIRHCPDVVIMDIAMPEISGLEATSRITQACPNVRVLILTMHESDHYFFQALQAGASGYALKGVSSADLIAAVRTTSRGDVYFHPSVAKHLVGDYLQRTRAGEEDRSSGGLSPREREVLKLVAEGYTNSEIAKQLFLSPSTVQTHRANLMQKLNLENRANLVQYALRHGLLESKQ